VTIAAVIPTLDEAARIGGLVGALHAMAFDEIVVVDGGSTDDTVAIARAAGAKTISSERGRGRQLAAGARAARADTYLFMHADSLPPATARDDILQALGRPGIVAGCFPLVFDADHPVLHLYAAMSRINLGLFTYGDQGLFVSRAAYERCGGYAALPLFEDVEILQRLRRQGRIAKLQRPMQTSSRRFSRDGIVRREALNALLVGLYHCGIAPTRLERLYRPEKAYRE
jgi:rSAM/selenodomain-associated transferase 2